MSLEGREEKHIPGCRDSLSQSSVVDLGPLSGLPERMVNMGSVVIYRPDAPKRDRTC